MQERKALDASAYALMVLCTALTLVMQGALSGVFALAALLVGAGIALVNVRR